VGCHMAALAATKREDAAHVTSATFKCPYQAHAPFGPNCALADVGPVMSSTQVYNSTTSASDQSVILTALDIVGRAAVHPPRP
jgi:hypothetical protein